MVASKICRHGRRLVGGYKEIIMIEEMVYYMYIVKLNSLYKENIKEHI